MAEQDLITKPCTRCGISKPSSSFHRCKRIKSGLASRCKQCEAETNKARNDKKADPLLRAVKKERALLLSEGRCKCIACNEILDISEFPSAKQNRWKCRSCMSAQRLEWSRENRDRDRANWKRSSKNNHDAKRERNARYRIANRDRLYAARRQWYQENKESFNAKNYAYQAERIASDPIYAMRRRVSRLIGLKIQNAGYTKRSKTQDILGCDWDSFKRHIERQFLRGMTWDNRSEWHLDHIIPASTAVTEEDVIRLNHHTNLRPMWAKDNLSKGAQLQTLL